MLTEEHSLLSLGYPMLAAHVFCYIHVRRYGHRYCIVRVHPWIRILYVYFDFLGVITSSQNVVLDLCYVRYYPQKTDSGIAIGVLMSAWILNSHCKKIGFGWFWIIWSRKRNFGLVMLCTALQDVRVRKLGWVGLMRSGLVGWLVYEDWMVRLLELIAFVSEDIEVFQLQY